MANYVAIYDSRRWVRSDSTDTTIVLPIAAGGTGNTTGTATVNANLTGPITSVGNATSIASQTGTGTTFVIQTNPALIGPTTDTLQTSGNVGVGVAPSGTNGVRVSVKQDGNQITKIIANNSDAASTGAATVIVAQSDSAIAQTSAFGSSFSGTLFGLNLAGQSSFNNGSMGTAGVTFGSTNAAPVRIGTNATAAIIIGATTQVVQVVAPIILKSYTVATLPAGTQGMRAFVTDANAPLFGQPVVGGGAVVTPVFYNGAAWVTA